MKRKSCGVTVSMIAVFFWLSGCQKAMAPEYQGFLNLKVSQMTVDGTRLSGNLKFYNPNAFSLKLKHAEIDIFINDKRADHYLMDSTIFIPRKDTFFVPVSLTIDMRNIFSNALQIFLNKEVKITLDGKVKLKKGLFPFTKPFHYDFYQKLDSLFSLPN